MCMFLSVELLSRYRFFMRDFIFWLLEWHFTIALEQSQFIDLQIFKKKQS